MRNDPHLAHRYPPGQRRACAVKKRITRSQNNDIPPAFGGNGLDRTLERAEPGAGFAGDRRPGQIEMPDTAKDHLRRCERCLGSLANAR